MSNVVPHVISGATCERNLAHKFSRNGNGVTFDLICAIFLSPQLGTRVRRYSPFGNVSFREKSEDLYPRWSRTTETNLFSPRAAPSRLTVYVSRASLRVYAPADPPFRQLGRNVNHVSFPRESRHRNPEFLTRFVSRLYLSRITAEKLASANDYNRYSGHGIIGCS